MWCGKKDSEATFMWCGNADCGEINRVPYGKTHRLKPRGIPCFAANTKLGIGMYEDLQWLVIDISKNSGLAES